MQTVKRGRGRPTKHLGKAIYLQLGIRTDSTIREVAEIRNLKPVDVIREIVEEALSYQPSHEV